ncbi:hypothetical protein [Paenibacillus daejeonensis]|uniref:hypothetical protein n=1 Tax=Paenibacillus daejeonensis TaxID=135193 RepID=UPI00037101A4|nr:hypothetical protein [Paenibacillus daejeonensis]
MNPKQFMIAGTMAFAVTIRSVMGREQHGERYPDCAPLKGLNCKRSADMTHLLGVSSEKIKDRLYAGDSLADIAVQQHADIEELIDLQVQEMTELMKQRVRNGSLSSSAYRMQCAEIRDILRQSAYRRLEESRSSEPQAVV